MGSLERDSIAIEKAEAVFHRWRGEGVPVWDGGDVDFKSYMDCIYSMQSLYDRTSGDGVSTSARLLNESAKRMLVVETPKLEEGLVYILDLHNNAISPERAYEAYKVAAGKVKASTTKEANVPSEDRGVCFIPENAIWRLHLIARAMVRRRLVRRCCRLIKQSRRPILRDSLRLLARQRFSPKLVTTLSWEDLQERVNEWRQFVKVAVVALLASERRICERVFNSADLSEFCFADISVGSEKPLFEFIEAFVSSKKTPERLFPMLDAYETLVELQPTFDDIFAGSGPCKALRNEMTVTMGRVGVAVRGVFQEFETHIEKEPSKPPSNASIHSLSSYVVNYLNFLYGYSELLTKLYSTTGSRVVVVPKLLRVSQEEDEDEDRDEYVEEYAEEEDEGDAVVSDQQFWGEPPAEFLDVSTLISRKLHCLETALREKARAHMREPEKQHFFLMNNIHYMARKVKENDLRKLLGDDWIRDAAERTQEHANEYMKLTWNKVTAILKEEVTSSGGFRAHLGLQKNAGAKDKLARFTAALEEVCQLQGSWRVNPGQLHAEMEQAVKRRVFTPYLLAYDKLIGSSKPPKNVKTPAEINDTINKMFNGSSASAP